jgi:hypothetical protein
MKQSEINKSGVYVATNLNKPDNRYLVLISGYDYFLRIESVWDLYHNCIADDGLRGKSFEWNEVKGLESMK